MRAVTWLLLLCAVPGSVRGSAWKGDGFRRQLLLELNPGLDPATRGVNLLHVRAVGDNDTLHMVLCSVGAPTLLLVHTNSTQSQLHVNWTQFLQRRYEGSVQVQPLSSVQYSSALVFTRLWEYDDVNDTADLEHLPPSSFLPPYELKNFTWDDLNATLDYTRHRAELCGRDDSPAFSNGSLCLQFSAFESGGREDVWPSLLHNANSSQLRVSLRNVASQTNNSHFAMELQTVSEPGSSSRVDTLRSIDDEYTPSIFQVSEWVWSGSNASSSVSSFVQWKPVVYGEGVPSLEDARPCHHSPPLPPPLPQLPPSNLLLAYCGPHHLTHGLNVSFATQGGDMRAITHSFTWTVLVGLGAPPSDFFSPMVIAVVAVALGTPLAIVLVGGVYACVRKRRQDVTGYRPIN